MRRAEATVCGVVTVQPEDASDVRRVAQAGHKFAIVVLEGMLAKDRLLAPTTHEQREVLSMTAIESKLIERLKKLPPNRLAEVVDFVDFLAAREERAAAGQRLTEGLARLDALNLPPISEEEVEDEVQASRRERLARQGL